MSFKTRKVAIIGTGHVGSHVAFALATQGLADELYMVDEIKEKAIAQAMDINDAVSYYPHHVNAIACEIEDCSDCDIMFISAGPLPDKENSDRLASLGNTMEVLHEILPRIKNSNFSGIIISISNPADVVAAYIQKTLSYAPHKIMSTGTALDSARLQRVVSTHLGVGRKGVNVYAMGEHGHSAMVPWSQANIAGKSLDLIQKEMEDRFPLFDRAQAVQDMKDGGYTVYFGKGSTEFGISSSAAEIVRAIFHDEKKLLPVSCYLDGPYDQHDVFASVPAIIGKDGVDTIIEVDLTEDEKVLFHNSCSIIREHIKKAETL